MISEAQEKSLLDICNRFINSGSNGLNLADLITHLDTTIPEKDGPDWEAWSKHMDALNEAWFRIVKEGENIPWPTAPIVTRATVANTPSNVPTVATSTSNVTNQLTLPTRVRTFRVRIGIIPKKWTIVYGNDSFQSLLQSIRNERKLEFDGGGGVGPARQPTSMQESKKSVGKPRDSITDDVIVEVDETPENKPVKYDKHGNEILEKAVYCIGCLKRATGRDPARVKVHGKNCPALARDFPGAFADMMKDLSTRSNSHKLGVVSAALHSESNNKVDKTETSTSQNNSAPAKSTIGTIFEYMNPAKITEQQKTRIEWTLFRMFICCALPWALLDSQFFEEFVHALSPNFVVPDRSSFFPKHLAQETAAWSEGFKKFIKNYQHLTFSFDGWSTKARDEMYTFHTTTPKRRSFFTDGHIFKGVSVTGDALLSVIVKIFASFDARNYSAIAGDGGSNVRSARIKVAELFPWILNIYDPCHNLSLFMKDVGKLFKDMLAIVSGIANYFGKSNYGTYHLDVERKKAGIGEGIKSHSDTRFSSSYYQVVSVNTCMSSIKQCVKSGVLKFDTAATKKLLPYITDGASHWLLMGKMTGFIHLLAGGANGLLTLEGQNTTCADVFYVWVCIAYNLEQVLANPGLVNGDLRPSVVQTYNARFHQMMKESSHHVFLLAYYLHPMYRHNGGLQLTMPVLPEGTTLPLDRYPALFVTLLKSVLEIFRGEQLRLEDSAKEVVPELINEFIAYANNKEPFRSHTWRRDTAPLKWWTHLSKDSNARLLGRVAVKIFSISPSEICDERTASRLGWFNSARRSSITPEHLVDSAKLYDLYVNGFEDGQYTHRARVHIPTVPTSDIPPVPTTRSAPTILDLLNTENITPNIADIASFEELLFNNPDPYDLDETNRVDEALMVDSEPVVFRSSTRFDIAEFVKLEDERLVAMITKVDSSGPGVDVVAQDAAQAPRQEGKPGEWSVESFFNAV